MSIDVIQIVVICIIAALCWWVNNTANPVPVLKTAVNVIIVVVSVLALLQGVGLISGPHVSVR